jgi:TetR/AcrR family transcriptional repressor of nem operon
VPQTTTRGAATRDRIVAAASALFAEQGVNGTGLDQVLRAAGASKSQLYQHFASKDALVLAVVAHRREHQSEPIVRALEAVTTRADLARWLDGYVESGADRDYAQGCPIGALASEIAESDPHARVALAGCFGSWREALVGIAQRLQESGDLPVDTDLETLARAQLALLEGGRLLAQTERDGRALRAAAAGTLALLDAPPRMGARHR